MGSRGFFQMHQNSISKRTSRNGVLLLIYSVTISSILDVVSAQRVKFANGVSGMFSKKVRPPVIEKLALSDTKMFVKFIQCVPKRLFRVNSKYKFRQVKIGIE